MKIMCYFVLFLAFFMYYQQEPAFTLIIVFLVIGVFVFFKVKKKGLTGNLSKGVFGFGKNNATLNNGMDPLSMILFQQSFMSNSFSNNKIEDKQVNNRIKSIDEAKEMILRLIKND